MNDNDKLLYDVRRADAAGLSYGKWRASLKPVTVRRPATMQDFGKKSGKKVMEKLLWKD